MINNTPKDSEMYQIFSKTKSFVQKHWKSSTDFYYVNQKPNGLLIVGGGGKQIPNGDLMSQAHYQETCEELIEYRNTCYRWTDWCWKERSWIQVNLDSKSNSAYSESSKWFIPMSLSAPSTVATGAGSNLVLSSLHSNGHHSHSPVLQVGWGIPFVFDWVLRKQSRLPENT